VAPDGLGVLHATWRLLTFRIGREELSALDERHLWFGLACTWLVGIGRFWDDPEASALHKSGLVSVAYVFGLAILFSNVLIPLRPLSFRFGRIVTSVALTAPPGILYAIPVEKFVEPETTA
jgi:hypothetical protein